MNKKEIYEEAKSAFIEAIKKEKEEMYKQIITIQSEIRGLNSALKAIEYEINKELSRQQETPTHDEN